MHRSDKITRRSFVTRLAGLGVLVILPPAKPASHCDAISPLEHPDPRPGITAEKVLSGDAIASTKERVRATYDIARRYPSVFDGIACGCGCSGKDAPHRSLLVCYETLQPTGCRACQLQAEFVGRMAKDEAPLAEIRAAVDKEFG